MKYIYGMRMRGFSLGCQPPGVIEWEDSNKSETGFHSFITYDRKLTDEEVERYELSFIKVIK